MLYKKTNQIFMLFGSPGCGKSHLLSAAANAANAELFVFNLWNLQSKNFLQQTGGSIERCLKSAFQIARDNSRSILCFEDIEVLSKPSEEMQQGKTSLLRELNAFMNDALDAWDAVVIIGVTQCPWDVDPEIKEAFHWLSGSLVTPPDENARFNILQQECQKLQHSLKSEDFKQLALQTEGFVGSELKCLVRGAAMMSLRKLGQATHFKKVIVQVPSCNQKEKSAALSLAAKNEGQNPSTLGKRSEARHLVGIAQCSDSIRELQLENSENNNDLSTSAGGDGNILENDAVNSDNSATQVEEENANSKPNSDPLAVKTDSCMVEKFVPCDSNDPNAISLSVFDIPEDKIHAENIAMEDFVNKLKNTKPCVLPEDHERMVRFAAEFCASSASAEFVK